MKDIHEDLEPFNDELSQRDKLKLVCKKCLDGYVVFPNWHDELLIECYEPDPAALAKTIVAVCEFDSVGNSGENMSTAVDISYHAKGEVPVVALEEGTPYILSEEDAAYLLVNLNQVHLDQVHANV